MTEGIKIIAENRKARHNYFIEDRYEGGLVLLGSEVKALREGRANLTDSYGVFKGDELYLLNTHISPYVMANRQNHEPTRTRKVLLKRSELNKLWGKTETRGYHLIPLKLYFKNGRAKVEMALCKSKKQFDKRATVKERESKRDLARIKKR